MIAVIGAMESEVELLRERMHLAVEHVHAGKRFYEGTLEGVSLVLAACGVGKVHAASCAQALIDRFQPTLIIFTGIAGSLDARIDIGDIVVSSDCVQHDFFAGPLGCAHGQIPGFNAVGFEADAELRACALASIRAAAPHARAFEGRIASGDRFIGDAARKERIVRTFGALCCEMEGAAVAQVAVLNELPFVVLRAISDKADGSADMDYPAFEVAAAHQGADVVCEMCRRLAR